MPEITCLYEAKDTLGEGPIWNDTDESLYWCDNIRSLVHQYEPAGGQVKTWPMPEEIGSLVFRQKGGIVAGMKSGFCFVDLEANRIDHIVAADTNPTNCLNDGKCDRRGRYWCGSINRDLKTPNGGLYRLDPDLTCHKLESGIIASNGMAFSPDDKVFYFCDSRQDTVWAYEYDIDSGRISNKRVFISTKDVPGRVDGATVDVEGNYWCAQIHDWHVACYSPGGKLIRRIKLPVRHPTMCTFGGENYDIMYVTSGTRFLEANEAAAQPLAGALFAIHDTGARGLPEPRFAG
jgi:sugar lactone lactonase YvrE